MKEETLSVKEFLGGEKGETALGSLPTGKSGTIIKVGGEGALRRRFLDMGLTPKTTVTIRKTAPMGDPIELSLRGYELTIRKEDAAMITVVPKTE